MNKKIITLLATGAVVATAAGSFAAWDTLSVTGSVSISINKLVVVKLGNMTAGAVDYTGENAVVEVPITLDIDGMTNFTGKTITFETSGLPTGYSVEILEGDTALTNNIDTAVETTNNYKAKITVDKTTATDFTQKDLSVKATLK